MIDLVVGMCGGYGAEALRPFLRSLRCSGFAGEAILFSHANPPGTAEALAAEGATVVAVALDRSPDPISYNLARYACCADLLARRPDARRVLLTDVRDVVFQRDPFTALADDGLHLFEEHPAKPIGRCIWTSSWIRFRYGDAALEPLRNRPVVCSGVVLGGAGAVRAFAELVAGEIDPALRATNYMAGYDQGVVNVLCHQGRVPGLTIHPYGRAKVLHLGNTPPGEVAIDGEGDILDGEGAPAVLVHQVDRHPTLAARMANRWGGPGDRPAE